MKILAIETSCDETAVAILEATGDQKRATYRVLGDALFSQVHLHAEYGGVFPTLAKREHQKNLVPLTIQALGEAGMLSKKATDIPDETTESIREEEFREDTHTFIKTHAQPLIDLIAVTRGPGLEPALWSGVSFAQSLSHAWDIPIIGINHMEGHVVSALVTKTEQGFEFSEPPFPLLGLLISGGHTEIVLMKEWLTYELVGKTRDDAVGEAFDKVARLLGLPYPGGPEVAKHAARSRTRGESHDVVFPRPMAKDATCDFSFSGLKTAVLYHLKTLSHLTQTEKENVAEAFEDAAAEIITLKTTRALEKTKAKLVAVGGGVSANTAIRNELEKTITHQFPDVSLMYPERSLMGDNAIMIGMAAHLRTTLKAAQKEHVKAQGSLSLTSY